MVNTKSIVKEDIISSPPTILEEVILLIGWSIDQSSVVQRERMGPVFSTMFQTEHVSEGHSKDLVLSSASDHNNNSVFFA